MEVIGENIRYLREINNLTQSQLALKLNISDKTISSWETNKSEPRMGMLEKLSLIFDCQKSDFMEENLKDIYNKNLKYKKIIALLKLLEDKDIEKTIEYIGLLINSNKILNKENEYE